MQSLYVALSGRNSTRICDTTTEQRSIDFLYSIDFHNLKFFLDINSPGDQVQS